MGSLEHFKKEVIVEYKNGILEYYPELELLIVIWKGSITIDEVHIGGKIFLQHIKNTPAKFLLFNQKVLKGTWIHSNDWLRNYWLHEVHNTKIEKIAVIPSHDEFTKYSLFKFVEKIDQFDINVFSKIEDALEWLLSEQSTEKIEKFRKIVTEDFNEKINSFNKLLHNKKIYLDHNISLPTLGKMLDIPPKDLSYIINKVFSKNFNEIINEYRVEEVKRALENGEDQTNLSIWGIGFEAGFNSRAAFYRAFKKMTNQTPTEYKNNLKRKEHISDNHLK